MGGNVGIGTDNPGSDYRVTIKSSTSPHSALRLDTTESDYNTNLYFAKQGINKWIIGNKADADAFRFVAGSTERLRITSTGRQQGHTDYAAVGINTFASWARTGGAIRAEVGYNAETTDYMYFGTGTNHPVALRVNNDTALYIKNDTGRSVGIGSDDPQSQFEVFGTSPIIRSKHSTSQAYTQINHDGTVGYLDWSSGSLLFRGASNTERLRITSGGALSFTGPGSIQNEAADTVTMLSGGTASNSGANIVLYGQSHASDANVIRFRTSATDRLRINADGKVGIGTDSLGHRFTVYGPNTVARFQSSTSYVDLMFQNTGATNGFIQYNNAGNFRFFANSGSTPTLTISSGSPGNVGIGEESPDCRFHIKDTINTAYTATNAVNSANNLIKVENASTTANAFAGMQFRVGSGADLYFGAIQQNTNAGDFYFANQDNPDVELMRIKSTGKVGIGTDNPVSPLHLQSTSANQSVLTISANNGRAQILGLHRSVIAIHRSHSILIMLGDSI